MATSPSKLRFYAQGTALVQNFEALDANITRFVGRKYDGHLGFDKTGEVDEVPNRAEYRWACEEGELAPADAETAKACGVSFAEAKSPANTDYPKPAVKAEKAGG